MPTIREALEQAASAPPSPPESAPAPVESAPEPVAAAEAQSPAPSSTATPTDPPPGERSRDEAGRYTKQEKKPEAVKGGLREAVKAETPPKDAGAVAEPPATPVPAPTPDMKRPEVYVDHKGRTVDLTKPPQSMPATLREDWNKLPVGIREHLSKQAANMSESVGEAVKNKQAVAQIQASLSPYESIARANGTDVMTWAGQALQERAAVMSGAPDAAMRVVAQGIQMLQQRFGPQALDHLSAMLQGQPAPQQAAPPVDINATVEKVLEQRLAKAQEARALSEAQSFVESAPEFLQEVLPDMLAIIEAEKARGRKVTYQDAYTRACKLNEEVAGILAQRKAAEGARTATAATQQARQAAVSVKTQPSQAPKADPKSVRGALEAAARHHGAG